MLGSRESDKKEKRTKKILRLCQHQNGNKGKKWEFTNKRIEGEEEKKKFCGDEEKMATPQRRFAM